MVFLAPPLEERPVATSLAPFVGVIKSDGGRVEKVDVWGRRRLANDIQKKSEGIYTVIDLTADPATVKELDRQLHLNETILRTKVIRPEVHYSRSTAGPSPMAAGDSTITSAANRG